MRWLIIPAAKIFLKREDKACFIVVSWSACICNFDESVNQIKFYIIKIKLLLIDKLKEYTWKRLKSNENGSFYMTHNSVHYMWFIPLQCDWIVDPDGWEASVIPLDWGWQRYLFAVQVTARESMNLNHDIIKNQSI